MRACSLNRQLPPSQPGLFIGKAGITFSTLPLVQSSPSELFSARLASVQLLCYLPSVNHAARISVEKRHDGRHGL